MGLSDRKRFSTDILRIELCGPDQPHLTMVDLPGLFRAGNQDQSLEDAATVKAMVMGYMEKPRSIILAVVSAKTTSLCKRSPNWHASLILREFAPLDSSQNRTLWILGLIVRMRT